MSARTPRRQAAQGILVGFLLFALLLAILVVGQDFGASRFIYVDF